MRLAVWLALVTLPIIKSQDNWKALPLTPLDPPGDSAMAAGLLIVPDKGALDVTLAFDNPCGAKVTATQQSRGAVVKIRLTGPGAGPRACAVSRPAEAYAARVAGLKPKRYQVIVYTADQNARWHPWKASVAEVP